MARILSTALSGVDILNQIIGKNWEPEAHLSGCGRMLRDFWVHVAGQAAKSQAATLPFGFEVILRKDWIDNLREEYRVNASKKEKKQKEIRHQSIEKFTKRSKSPSAMMVDSDDGTNDIQETSKDLNVTSTIVTIPRIPSPIAVVSETHISEDDLPFGAINEATYSDPDDTPLSQIQVLHTSPQNTKRKRSDEDTREDRRKRPFSPSVAAVSVREKQIQDTSPVNKPPREDHALDILKSTTPNIPAHRLRKMNPKVKPITVGDELQGISTKSRIAKSGSGSKATMIDKALPGTISPQMDADLWLNESFPSPVSAASPIIQSAAHIALPSFGKIWKWTGKLYIKDNESKTDGPAERIGNVKMMDYVPGETRPNDLPMKSLLPQQPVQTLCFRNTYSLPTLPTALDDFRISHFVRMVAEAPNTEAEGENQFPSLVTFMERNLLYSIMPIMMGERNVATMFVVPASVRHIWDIIKLPEKLRNVDATPSLVVAIGIRLYEPPKREYGYSTSEDDLWKSKYSDFSSNYLFSFSDLGRAAMRLEFPEYLFKRLSNRTYSIFTGSMSPTAEGDPYTQSLNFVLNKIPGTEKIPLFVGDARCIFIHVGAWGMLHKLLGLVDRRLRRVDVQFFTYGANPTVERRFWGIQEIFPIGGIVTFTSQAILENSAGVLGLIGQLHEQALWSCYIHPAVISMLVKILMGGGITTETNVDKIFYALSSLTGILKAIEKEQVELMWHPPPPFQWQGPSSSSSLKDLELKKINWILEQDMLSKLRGLALTGECERLFPAANRTEKDVEKVLVDDMVVMQSEYRKNYRRFVIITDVGTTSNTSKQAAHVSASSCEVKDMFEFTHVGRFEFSGDISRQSSKTTGSE
ncbi:hypothetical protein Clacol_003811 [Clathrus columnatus]|uniref:Uncharacterized protein n=1 Tax=Clathrus columnatus TaxID=1419009 RepID=A0AAV5A7Z5_9AGAM|nr:hypothetical protein Clacol_003811 [Clathrus columnatus]